MSGYRTEKKADLIAAEPWVYDVGRSLVRLV